MTLKAFAPQEMEKAHRLLASKVASMMGRKFEEGDWTEVYCAAKGIPNSGWSNLDIDVVYDGVGVEHKMLCVRSRAAIRDYCGDRLMHPAATRAIRIDQSVTDATEMARDILEQYGDLIRQRTERVRQASPSGKAEMRTGWLLWQVSLEDFLYFEEELLPPDPEAFWGEWRDSGGGRRRTSKNVWVYEIDTGIKRFSITTSAGPKVQPYFDVPPPSDPNLAFFRVQGELVADETVRVWINSTTAIALETILGSLDQSVISGAIRSSADKMSNLTENNSWTVPELAREIYIDRSAYEQLRQTFQGVSDEHRIQSLLSYLHGE